ncbi:glycoside hydrolase family 16 protein [Methylobacterium dankookense]|uniref:Endo-1,3-1,4-beta-glycanase ExsH n=1 Tax=Methylobacterium dankookense TaxID=560405 RepID=A0A564FYX5_9HYPH|nr:glycoside hydrolase family 16 protein [Methylobacterium dankookense]GJD54723.1 hypothetical protein IFDJLNFL_0602 [Methylobacterium dankookense]VUF12591.1 Endo-1,3-1,4-beta-glycanase ExsH [Methylobacterium dankookense]
MSSTPPASASLPRARAALAVLGLVLVAILASAGPDLAQAPTPESSASEPPFALQLLSPGPTSVATHNQKQKPEAYTASIPDAAMRVRAGPLEVTGLARGLRSVALVVNGTWTSAVPGPDSRFTTQLDLSGAVNGPLVLDVYGWDTPPDNHDFKTALNLRVHLFVEGGRDASPAAERPPGHPAHGRTLVWSESFDTLSRKVWHAGPKPDGQEYGAASFLGYDDPTFDPYTIMGGFLRIRSQNRPGWADPAGYGRTWLTGHLSTGFPDGSVSGAFRKGYFEARMLLPAGPGAWPSFWLLDQHGIRNSVADGAVEIDVIEGYGHATTSYVATEHDWPPPSSRMEGYRRAQKNLTGLPDYSLAFHDYGVEITDDDVVFYFDGIEKFRAPLYRKATVSPFFMMLTLAMSQDWPITVPPAGYYDLWIDHVRVYR